MNDNRKAKDLELKNLQGLGIVKEAEGSEFIIQLPVFSERIMRHSKR
jgi:hypothetical protein